MTFGGHTFHDFPEKRLTKIHAEMHFSLDTVNWSQLLNEFLVITFLCIVVLGKVVSSHHFSLIIHMLMT